MRRSCSMLVRGIVSRRFVCQCAAGTQRRLLLKPLAPASSPRLSFSAAVRSEESPKPEDDQNKKPITSTLKDGSKRISSAEFLAKVKKEMGAEVSDEQFVIPRSAFDALAAEYDLLVDETVVLKDKYTRALAESENVRRRGQKQVADAKVFAIQGFCKDLLEVADILDLAVGAVKKEEVDGNEKLKGLYDGIVMTRTVLAKTFAKHGLRKVSPVGEKFDPNLHEAITMIPKEAAEKVEPGCVAHVMSIGYALHDRPIRAAKVCVVRAS